MSLTSLYVSPSLENIEFSIQKNLFETVRTMYLGLERKYHQQEFELQRVLSELKTCHLENESMKSKLHVLE